MTVATRFGASNYPIGYVRWTENRNMAALPTLCGESRLQIEPLITNMSVSNAPEAMKRWPTTNRTCSSCFPLKVPRRRPSVGPSIEPAFTKNGRITIALLGAGESPKMVQLPNLRALRDLYEIRAVVSPRHNAAQVAQQSQQPIRLQNMIRSSLTRTSMR